MQSYRVNSVFVPGGMPEHTFIDRAERSIRQRLESAQDNLCKLVTLTGNTKSGKTVLTKMVYPGNMDGIIWIEGGSVAQENDLWSQILEATESWTEVETGNTSESGGKITGGIEAGANVLIAKGKGKVGAEYSKASSDTSKRKRSISPKVAALSGLKEICLALVIDDFHYLDRKLQGLVVRALKPLVFEGLPVILIAIPHRRYDAIKVEREITGRLENIEVPFWTNQELQQIPEIGFPLLHIKVSERVIDKLTSESQGSPHLMQEFCRELCLSNGISSTSEELREIISVDDELFRRVASTTGKVIYDRLAIGPRQRSDRIPRKLKDGTEVDIYRVILLALSHMKPGMDTISYEQLRASIREILVDHLPQAHEISRVLEKMSEIAYSDEDSTPVIDWEKEGQILHITDPFFAFYLKWGVPPMQQAHSGQTSLWKE